MAMRVAGLCGSPFSRRLSSSCVGAYARNSVLQARYSTQSTSPPPSQNAPFHVCIVGSGPSGFYTCESILSQYPNARILTIKLFIYLLYKINFN